MDFIIFLIQNVSRRTESGDINEQVSGTNQKLHLNFKPGKSKNASIFYSSQLLPNFFKRHNKKISSFQGAREKFGEMIYPSVETLKRIEFV